MYHDTPAVTASDYFSVAAPALQQQMRVLQDLSLRGATLESLLDVEGSTRVDDGRVAITFDDGHRSNYEVALPLLAQHGATATIFVVTSWVGTTGYCTWQELRELQKGGWSIQSHTKSHPFLSQLPEAAVRAELESSRTELEQKIGAPVVTLALPNGDFPRSAFTNLIAESGYRWVATSRWGPNATSQLQRRQIRRYTVRRNTTPERFRELASGTSSAWSREGVRLSCLGAVRRALGPDRYRKVRSAALSILR